MPDTLFLDAWNGVPLPHSALTCEAGSMIDILDCPDVPGPEVAPKKRGGGPKTPEGKERAKARLVSW
jgi:hypothetical protein